MKARVVAPFAVGLAAFIACALRDTRVGGAGLPCHSNTQCSSDSVCFLGECRGSSTQLALVEAEVHAPVSEQLGPVQRNAIDLRVSPVADFHLSPLLSASGTVTRRLDDGGIDSVADAGVVLTASAPPIPDRVPSVATQTSATGAFSVSFPDSTWNVLVVPPAPEPLARLAPPASPLSSSTSGLQVVLPAPRELTSVTSALLTGGIPLAGARVVAVDANGSFLSAPTIADAQGTFSIQLPPPPLQYFLQVGPDPAASSSSVAIPAFPPRGPFSSGSPGSSCPAAPGNCLDLGALPDPATLNGTVLDGRQQSIASVAVLAVSVDPSGWVISRQTLTDANGAFALALRTGSYAVKAVPPTDPAAPALSAEVMGPVPSAGSLTLTCPEKSRATGTVLRPDGQSAGAGYQVAAIRFSDRLVAGRAASTTATDATGSFSIVGDAGQYRVEIVPPVGSGLPRTIVALELATPGPSIVLPPVKLSPPLSVVGTVTKQTNAPVAGATVDFLALDASGVRSILIGSGVTDALGRYQAVLPDVAAPAAMAVSP